MSSSKYELKLLAHKLAAKYIEYEAINSIDLKSYIDPKTNIKYIRGQAHLASASGNNYQSLHKTYLLFSLKAKVPLFW